MRARTLFVLGVLLLSVGCTQSEEAAPPAETLSRTEIARAVLTAGDVGGGWTKVDNPSFSTVQIGGRVGPANIKPSEAQATSAFKQADGNGYVSNSVFQLRNEETAQAVIAAHQDATNTSTWTQERTDGGRATFRFSGAVGGLTALGDELYAARLKSSITDASNNRFEHFVEYCAYRIGAVVAVVIAENTEVDPLARRQEANVARLLS